MDKFLNRIIERLPIREFALNRLQGAASKEHASKPCLQTTRDTYVRRAFLAAQAQLVIRALLALLVVLVVQYY